jgi:hypothetical protein
MSTKLTARKRYLPRIVNAANKLTQLKLNTQSTAEAVTYFTSEEYTDLLRAMNLYGFSLRKGEAPDEISRKEEQLTQSFANSCSAFVASKTTSDLNICLDDFDAYKSFSKIE